MSAVGFVGLGQMGSCMAARLVEWPDGLVVCDVRDDAVQALVAQGATAAPTPAAVAAVADVVSVMVFDDDQVRDVVAGPDGVLAAGRRDVVVAIHSTIRPETAESLAAECAPLGVAIVDAPVSGGVIGAVDGRLAVMLGGDDAAVARCREPFRHWAELVVHVGAVGAGTRTKVARNIVHFVSFAAAAEAQRLAEAAGIELRKLAKVVRHTDGITGGPGAVMVRDSTAPLSPSDALYDVFVHTRALGEKDLALALELAADLDVDLPLVRVASERLAAGLGVPHSSGDA
jgi:3-hydroxyisobutyrate dehydrogenase-like beta-hydroxyacid dehydrogenase